MKNWLWLCALLLSATPCMAAAQDNPDADIRAALTTWMQDFNAGRTDRVCGLFSTDLRFDFRGQPERGFREICDQLRAALSDRSRRFSYALKIKEVLISGDLAVVRLAWRSTLRAKGAAEATTEEPGLDVFRRQPDGSWKIIRYIAYEAEP